MNKPDLSGSMSISVIYVSFYSLGVTASEQEVPIFVTYEINRHHHHGYRVSDYSNHRF